jgi:hypothetical protein
LSELDDELTDDSLKNKYLILRHCMCADLISNSYYMNMKNWREYNITGLTLALISQPVKKKSVTQRSKHGLKIKIGNE